MPTSNAATDAPDVNTAPTVAAAQPEVDLSSSQQKNANESVMPPRRFWQLSILQRVTISQILYILLFAAAAVLIFVVNHNQQSAQQAVDVNGIYRVHAAAASLGAGLVAVDGEMLLLGSTITPLKNSCAFVVSDPERTRKLLLNKREIGKLIGHAQRSGYTIIPLKLYWKGSWAKLEIGIARGKQEHDKRDSIKNREWQRAKERIMKKSF